MIPWAWPLLLALGVRAEEPAPTAVSLAPLPAAVGVEAVRLPVVEVGALPGGASLWAVEQPGAPLVALELRLTLPVEAVSPEERGALALLPAGIDAGARGAPAGGLDAQLEPLGASVLLAAEPAGLRLRLLAPPERFGAALAVVAEALREPALSGRVLRREREALGALLARQRSSNSGMMRVTELAFHYPPEHPLAPLALAPPSPSRGELRAVHQRLLDEGGAQLVLAGPPLEGGPRAAVEAELGALGAPPAPAQARVPRPQSRPCQPSFIASGGAAQLRVSVSWLVPEGVGWAEAQAVADLLGGGATARLDRRLREELGLVYEARARLIREAGHARLRVSMRVSNEQAVQALAALQEELRAMGLVDDTDLRRARATRLFSVARDLDGAEPSAAALRSWSELGLEPSLVQEELDALGALQLGEATAAAELLLDPTRAHWVLLGDGELLAEIACLTGLMPGCDRSEPTGPSVSFCRED